MYFQQKWYALHPIIIHFPIALLVFAIFFFLIGHSRRNYILLIVAKWNFVSGLLMLLAALISGLVAERFTPHASEAAHRTLLFHKYFAIGTFSFFSLLAMAFRKSLDKLTFIGKDLFIALLLLGLVAIGITGYLGGELVYRFGVGVNGEADHTHKH